MLKKRSIAVNSKKGLMFDHISVHSPTRRFTNKPTASPLIPSPEFFMGFSDTEAAAMSPTSILEAKPFSATGHQFDRKPRVGSNNLLETKHHPWDVSDSKSVGLGILDALSNEKTDKKSSNLESRMVLLGSQLKVQIPSTSQNGSVESPHSVIEFGVKNKNSQLAMALLSPSRKSLAAADGSTPEPPPPILCLCTSEMELSEDYTRVVSHGPNPRTTHIFDTCINGLNSTRKEIRFSADGASGYPSEDILAFCNACRMKLGHGKDIFMYREKRSCLELAVVVMYSFWLNGSLFEPSNSRHLFYLTSQSMKS